MFRATVRASENTDVEDVVADLRIRCDRAGLDSQVAELVVSQSQAVLAELVERGRQVASVGSQMHMTREISGDGFAINLIFRAGDRRTFFQRLMDILRGR